MDTRILLLLLYFFNNKTESSSQNSIHTIKNYLLDIEIKKDYTNEKIKIGKKLLPLLPTEYSSTFSRSILITEKILKIVELKEFINSHEETTIASINLEPKERLQRMIYTIQDEVKSSNIDEFGMVLDLVLNLDKYKKILSAYTNLNKNKNIMSDSERISMLMEIFMDNNNVKDKEKVNDMLKMLDMIKILNGNDNIEDKPNKD